MGKFVPYTSLDSDIQLNPFPDIRLV